MVVGDQDADHLGNSMEVELAAAALLHRVSGRAVAAGAAGIAGKLILMVVP
jgi:hypothetical protein